MQRLTISLNTANSSSIRASLAICLQSTLERLRDQLALEVLGWNGRRHASGRSKHVYELEHKETWERATQVADTTVCISIGIV